jgi:hypothetical protein
MHCYDFFIPSQTLRTHLGQDRKIETIKAGEDSSTDFGHFVHACSELRRAPDHETGHRPDKHALGASSTLKGNRVKHYFSDFGVLKAPHRMLQVFYPSHSWLEKYRYASASTCRAITILWVLFVAS